MKTCSDRQMHSTGNIHYTQEGKTPALSGFLLWIACHLGIHPRTYRATK